MFILNNALELFENYKNYFQKNGTPLSCVYKTQMALLYCLIPMLGGARIVGERSTKNELEAAMSFLKTITLEEFINAVKNTKTFMERENIPKNKQREYWTYLKKLINWANEQQYIIKNQSYFGDKLPVSPTPHAKKKVQVKNNSLSILSEKSAFKYSSDSEVKEQITLKLHSQIEDYRKFLIEERGLCEYKRSSVDANIAIVKYLLKWLYTEKNVSLDKLCLETIVPLLQTKPKRADYKDVNGVVNQKSYLRAKREFEQQVAERNKQTIFLLKDFLEFHSKGLSTRINVILAVINIAKFMYRDNTNTKIARNFEDIEIIELLRKLRREEISNFKMVRRSRTLKSKATI